jgi:hypothetical protein
MIVFLAPSTKGRRRQVQGFEKFPVIFPVLREIRIMMGSVKMVPLAVGVALINLSCELFLAMADIHCIRCRATLQLMKGAYSVFFNSGAFFQDLAHG